MWWALLFGLIGAVIVAMIADHKGRNAMGWFLFGLVLWPIALVAILLEHFLIGRNRRGFPSMVICDSRCGLVKEAGLHDETSFQRHSRTACICG